MVQIVIDSAGDLTTEEVQAKGLVRVSMPVRFGDETFLDGVDLTKEAFYERLERGEYPATSQPSPEAFREAFASALEQGNEVLVIPISSGLSGTIQGAMLARDMLPDGEKVHIVDSGTAAIGLRLIIDQAVSLRDQGLSAGEIAGRLEEMVPRLRLFATIDTLKYLQKGGRLSRSAAALGTLANLKPIIQVPLGPVEVVGKAIGTRRALEQVMEKVQKENLDPDGPVYMVYAKNRENCDKLREMLQKIGVAVKPEDCYDLGPTIGTHVGPGAAGIAFLTKA